MSTSREGAACLNEFKGPCEIGAAALLNEIEDPIERGAAALLNKNRCGRSLK
jgi:hypothetical protein